MNAPASPSPLNKTLGPDPVPVSEAEAAELLTKLEPPAPVAIDTLAPENLDEFIISEKAAENDPNAPGYLSRAASAAGELVSNIGTGLKLTGLNAAHGVGSVIMADGQELKTAIAKQLALTTQAAGAFAGSYAMTGQNVKGALKELGTKLSVGYKDTPENERKVYAVKQANARAMRDIQQIVDDTLLIADMSVADLGLRNAYTGKARDEMMQGAAGLAEILDAPFTAGAAKGAKLGLRVAAGTAAAAEKAATRVGAEKVAELISSSQQFANSIPGNLAKVAAEAAGRKVPNVGAVVDAAKRMKVLQDERALIEAAADSAEKTASLAQNATKISELRTHIEKLQDGIRRHAEQTALDAAQKPFTQRAAGAVIQGTGDLMSSAADRTRRGLDWLRDKRAAAIGASDEAVKAGDAVAEKVTGLSPGVVDSTAKWFGELGDNVSAAGRLMRTIETSTPYFQRLAKETDGWTRLAAQNANRVEFISRIGRGAAESIDGAFKGAVVGGTIGLLQGDSAEGAGEGFLGGFFGGAVRTISLERDPVMIRARQIGDIADARSRRTGLQQRMFDEAPKSVQLAAATFEATNPNLIVDLVRQKGSGGSYNVNPDGTGTATIDLDSRLPLVPLLAHEVTHHIGRNPDIAADIKRRFLGDEATGQAGIFTEMKDGKLQPKQEFTAFRDEYLQKLRDAGKDTSAYEANPELIVHEVIAEAGVSSLLAVNAGGELAGIGALRRNMRPLAPLVEQMAKSDLVLGVGVLQRALMASGAVFSDDGRFSSGTGLFESEMSSETRQAVREILAKYDKMRTAERDGQVESFSETPTLYTEQELVSNPELMDLVSSGFDVDIDPATGKRKFLTAREASKREQEFIDDLMQTLDASPDLSPGRVRRTETKDGRTIYTGKYIPADVLETLQSRNKYNPRQLEMLTMVTELLKKQPGNEVHFVYQPATTRGSRLYKQRAVTNRVETPISILISKTGGVLFNTISQEKVMRNLEFFSRKGMLTPWNGDVRAARADLLKYIDNTVAGREGADGIGIEKRDALNALFGQLTLEQRDRNPALQGMSDAQGRKIGVVQSRRIDRTNQMKVLDSSFQANYDRVSRNLRPEDRTINSDPVSYFTGEDGQPRVFYRGHSAEDPSLARKETTLPSFTDSKDIASVYAGKGDGARVSRVNLDIKNPLKLGDVQEDVVSFGDLESAITASGKVSKEEFRRWANSLDLWRLDGEEINLTVAESSGNLADVYTDTYSAADSSALLELAKRAGYDGYVYRGTFVSEDAFNRATKDVAKDSSYDRSTFSALEARPFSKNQIKDAPVDNRQFRPETDQEFGSAETSLEQRPALFASDVFKPNGKNLDIGAGAYDKGKNYLEKVRGVDESVPLDPFQDNRIESNLSALERLANGERFGTVTVPNVLNVIKEPAARTNVIRQAAFALEPGAKAYFQIYQGDESGTGRQTSKGWQNNRKAQDYVADVEKVFRTVERRGNIIVASEPRPTPVKPSWLVTGEGPSVQFRPDEMGFYSQLERTLSAIPAKASRQQIEAALRDGVKEKGQLKERPVKAEEMADVRDVTGLSFAEWMKQNPQATREQMLDFARENRVQVKKAINEGDDAWAVTNGGEEISRHTTEANAINAIEDMMTSREQALVLSENSGRLYDTDYGSKPLYLIKQTDDGGWDIVEYHNDDVIASLKNRDQALHELELIRLGLLREYRNQFDYQRDGDAPKFAQWSLPGGKNYQEHILTLPETGDGASGKIWFIDENAVDEFLTDIAASGLENADYGRVDGGPVVEFNNLSTNQLKTFRDNAASYGGKVTIEKDASGDSFTSEHFDDVQGYLSHVRSAEHRTKDGNKVYLVEEIQSDLHQKGREKGYRKKDEPGADVFALNDKFLKLTKELSEIDTEHDRLLREADGVDSRKESERLNEIYRKASEIQAKAAEIYALREKVAQEIDQLKQRAEAVQDAPFKKSWHEMGFKYMLNEAVRSGADYMAWTTGEQQAARYNLSGQVERIDYSKNDDGTYEVRAFAPRARGNHSWDGLTEPKLVELVGKDIAKRMVAGEGVEMANGNRALSGVQLTVGGEGMKAFYDRIIPQFADKYLKKFGTETEDIQLVTGAKRKIDGGQDAMTVLGIPDSQQNDYWNNLDSDGRMELFRKAQEKANSMTVHAVRITPELRDSVRTYGQAMYRPEGKKIKTAAYDQVADQTFETKDRAKNKVMVSIRDRYADQAVFPEAMPLEFQVNRANKIVISNQEPKIATKDYDFHKSPVVAALGLSDKTIESIRTKLNVTTLGAIKDGYIDKTFTTAEKAALKDIVNAYADRAIADFSRYADDKDVKGAAGWYTDIAIFFKGLIPEPGDRTKFLEFLGGTSPNTSVEQNFLYALDLFNRWKNGDFTALHSAYRGVINNFDALAGEYAEYKPVLLKSGRQAIKNGQPLFEWVFKPGAETKLREELRQALIDDGVSAKDARKFSGEKFSEDMFWTLFNLRAGVKLEREGGGKYGVHTERILQILDGVWRDVTDAPKAPNFTENLAGLSTRATIDVWAARWLRRLGHDGLAPVWRILPMAEKGVANSDFFLGQEIFEETTRRINDQLSDKLGRKITPDDLQAIMWFAEKREWTRRGWNQGEDLGDFRQYTSKMEARPDGTFILNGVVFNSTSLNFLKTLHGVEIKDATLKGRDKAMLKQMRDARESQIAQAMKGDALSPSVLAQAEQKYLAAQAERGRKVSTADYRE